MFSRKQHSPLTAPWTAEKTAGKHSKTKEHIHTLITSQSRYNLLLFASLSAWLLVLAYFNLSPATTPSSHGHGHDLDHDGVQKKPKRGICNGDVLVYVYDLPSEFNLGMLPHCANLNIYTNMCPHVANHGLGQPISSPFLPGSAASPDGSSWFAAHQFLAEMIFHARVENHPCRTMDPGQANLFYVPFYGGLHASSMFREANHTVRDELAVRLVEHLQSQSWWLRHQGKDHFLALGRTSWDFMRTQDGPDFGANILLNLPPVLNMSVLTVERNPWRGSNQHGIPYASYFHPRTRGEMSKWQHKMQQSSRPYLFSFIGGRRKGLEKAAIRDEFIRQCSESTRCKLVLCGSGASKCHDPSEVVTVMSQSQFCLQAPGDSFTRRSTFDSVLAGCIPVFFSPHTAYTQYTAWYLPENGSEYSVFMDEKGEESKRIEEELMKIPAERVAKMQSAVIDLIPRLTYAHPNATDHVGFEDAVDVALAGLAKHVRSKLPLRASSSS